MSNRKLRKTTAMAFLTLFLLLCGVISVFPLVRGSRSQAVGAPVIRPTEVVIGDVALARNSRSADDYIGQNVSKTSELRTPTATTITHSVSQTITQFNSVSCNNSSGHADNSYFRVFDLAAFGISSDFNVTDVQIGIESAYSDPGNQPLDVNLYILTNPTLPLTFGNLTPIGNASVNIVDQDLSLFNIAVTGTAPANSHLVVEIFTPNGQASNTFFFIGSNNLGETAPSYLAAAACGITEPVTTAALGFPDMHIVMNVTGDTGAPTPTPPPSGAPILLVDDDDNTPDVRSYYTTALNALGVSYDIWDTDNSDSEPNATYLANYDIVVWFTG